MRIPDFMDRGTCEYFVRLMDWDDYSQKLDQDFDAMQPYVSEEFRELATAVYWQYIELEEFNERNNHPPDTDICINNHIRTLEVCESSVELQKNDENMMSVRIPDFKDHATCVYLAWQMHLRKNLPYRIYFDKSIVYESDRFKADATEMYHELIKMDSEDVNGGAEKRPFLHRGIRTIYVSDEMGKESTD